MNNRELLERFGKDGYVKFKVDNYNFVQKLLNTVKTVNDFNDLSSIHKIINSEDLNDIRMKAFREINSLDNWENEYYSLSALILKDLLGPDIAIQSKLNLSIQMPSDKSSLLDLHTDCLSGQSVFEIVAWLPLTKAYSTNSMYVFPLDISRRMLKEMSNHELEGMKFLFEKYQGHAQFVELDVGEILLFSSTLFHGNIVNSTEDTRVSVNCRFKNIFSHESSTGERRLGSFYRVLKLSPLTTIGLSYRDDLVDF